MTGPYEHEPTSPEMERRQTFEAVASFLATLSRRRPVLIVLDDVQHAPASTLELVHVVLRWDRAARLLVVATARETSALAGRLGTTAPEVQLGALGPAAVTDLARAAGHAELADDLMRLTRGHTLFVLEALRRRGGRECRARHPRDAARRGDRSPRGVRSRRGGTPTGGRCRRCRLRCRARRRAARPDRRGGRSARRARATRPSRARVRCPIRVRQRRDPPSGVRDDSRADSRAPPPPAQSAARRPARDRGRARRRGW